MLISSLSSVVLQALCSFQKPDVSHFELNLRFHITEPSFHYKKRSPFSKRFISRKSEIGRTLQVIVLLLFIAAQKKVYGTEFPLLKLLRRNKIF